MIILCLVAILWGVTNPYLKNGAKGLENVSHPKEMGKLIYALIKFATAKPCCNI